MMWFYSLEQVTPVKGGLVVAPPEGKVPARTATPEGAAPTRGGREGHPDERRGS